MTIEYFIIRGPNNEPSQTDINNAKQPYYKDHCPWKENRNSKRNQCNEVSIYWKCTRPKGHTGAHECAGGRLAYARWTCKEQILTLIL